MPGRLLTCSLPSSPYSLVRSRAVAHTAAVRGAGTRLLDVRDEVALVGDTRPLLRCPRSQLVLEPAGEVLRLATGQLERGVLGALALAVPLVVVTPQGARVVLELDEVQPLLAQHQQVDLVPPALGVAELEVGPRAER